MPDLEAVRREPEGVADDLGEHGLEPGAHGRGPGVHREPAVGTSLDVRRLERPEPRLLHVDGEPDATPGPGDTVHARLLGPLPVVVEPPEQLVEERGEVAGVVHRRDAERRRAAVVRHLVGADQVAPPDLGRIEREPGGCQVHQPLAREVALGAARRAQRAHRRLVGDDGPEVAGVGGHAVRSGQERRAELGRHNSAGTSAAVRT